MFNFERAYNRNELKNFLRNDLLPEDYRPSEEDFYIENISNKVIKEVRSLGYSEELDLIVFEMKHDSPNDPRVSITKESFDILKQTEYSAALIFFVSSTDTSKYRFSLIYFDYLENGGVKRSNPRRLSFSLGKDIPCHTANDYLNKGRVANLEDLKNRFAIETLTDNFYNELSRWYAWALDSDKVKFPDCFTNNEEKNKANKAQHLIRLLTRLLFVWFIKQKNLIPNQIFDEKILKDSILVDFSPNDKKSTYYKAILQNLFFATLNCPITEEGTRNLKRGFRTTEDDSVNYLMHYKFLFKDPKSFVDMMNEKVPFLNGALFECLDVTDDSSNTKFIDGFSESMDSSKLEVPNYFFFGERNYNDSSQSWKIGLLDILKNYNFTVEENTPADIEVSLDPELLGKVFENLLASYNPETQESARKDTGSFYTPREIVQFMVDESLLEYLKNKTDGKVSDNNLRSLLAYNEEAPELDESVVKLIINAIYELRILDPACGSGAFPMGILQQLVHVLRQLDPLNENWQEIVLNVAEKDTNIVNSVKYSQKERDERLRDINSSFDEELNNPDYSRKLFLIENCIYGVDIQPIAAQISKLRFFISLVVDQNPTSDKKNNFGIKPLPNLEAKIVAANTLLKIEKENSLFDNDNEIITLKSSLSDALHLLFNAKTEEKKKKYIKIINEKRNKLRDILQEEELGSDDMRKITAWNMFDQNSSANFFDPEWMFGFDCDDSFDIVIGNPPYIQLQENGGELADLYKDCHYESFARRGDIYCLFYERGIQLLKEKGILSFITSNKWMRAAYGESLRGFLSKYNPLTLVDFGGTRVFKSATVDTNILIIQKKRNEEKTRSCKANDLPKDCRSYMSDFFNSITHSAFSF